MAIFCWSWEGRNQVSFWLIGERVGIGFVGRFWPNHFNLLEKVNYLGLQICIFSTKTWLLNRLPHVEFTQQNSYHFDLPKPFFSLPLILSFLAFPVAVFVSAFASFGFARSMSMCLLLVDRILALTLPIYYRRNSSHFVTLKALLCLVTSLLYGSVWIWRDWPFDDTTGEFFWSYLIFPIF